VTPDEIGKVVADLIRAELAKVAPPAAANFLTVQQAAARLNVSVPTLYKRAKKAPYSSLLVDNGTNRLLFSAQKIDEFLGVRT
jgi:excisionase family DNA binding protein